MSGVYARKRSVSSFEFYNTAIKIKNTVNKAALNEKIVPKRYRLTNAVPLVDMARSCLHNITRADQFYPNREENVEERRKYLTLAIADCEQLCLELQSLLSMGSDDECGPKVMNAVNIDKLAPIVELCELEIKLLKGARKGVKLVGRGAAASRKKRRRAIISSGCGLHRAPTGGCGRRPATAPRTRAMSTTTASRTTTRRRTPGIGPAADSHERPDGVTRQGEIRAE